MKAYTVHYQLHLGGETKSVSFLANNKQEAYDWAVYSLIPEIEKESPYFAYVYSVTYQNGKQKIFNF